LLEENRQRCHPPLPDDEVSGIAASVGRYPQGMAHPNKTRRADVRCLADVQAQAVEWLWEPYIPLKMITVVSGDPGAGKTFLSLALAASLTQGKGMVTGTEAAPCNVLYLSHENSPEHVTRPRFDALEGDVSRFFLLEGTKTDDGTAGRITLADLEQLEEAITEHKARLVIIDPLQSFLGGDVDAHRANQTRPIFDGLIRLAEKTGCALLITRHLSKGLGGSALYRGMGSIDITGAARSELLIAKEPDQEGRIVMAQSKNSLAEFGPSLTYSIGSDKKLHWHGKSSFKANDLLTAPSSAEERSAVDEAEDFLRETLADGPRLVKEVQSQAEEEGISKATLRRAQSRLRIEKKPGGFGKGWVLSLPSVAQESSELLIPT
jgi:RecA-family ATPase